MRKLIVMMQVSLDGFVGRPDGELDWIFPDFSGDAVAWLVDSIGQAGAHVMGRHTYVGMAAHWPSSTEPYAPAMNNIPKVVFSRTLTTAAWNKTEIRSADLATEIGRLKSEPGKDLLAHGGSGFVRSLTRAGLVDEYRLLIHPVALGEGLKLFDTAEPIRLKHVSTTTFESGLIAAV